MIIIIKSCDLKPFCISYLSISRIDPHIFGFNCFLFPPCIIEGQNKILHQSVLARGSSKLAPILVTSTNVVWVPKKPGYPVSIPIVCSLILTRLWVLTSEFGWNLNHGSPLIGKLGRN
jgi:hypothetical protein